MNIDVEPKDLGPVVQLVAKSDGWKPEETRYSLNSNIYFSGNPNLSVPNQVPDELIKSFRIAWFTTEGQETYDKKPKFSNGLKVSVSELSVTDDGILHTNGVMTDFYTLWGLTHAPEVRDLFENHLREVAINRAISPLAIYKTSIPRGISSHNVLLDKNGCILMMVSSQAHAFSAGKVSITEEEQMEPIDNSPFDTSARSFTEELGLTVPSRKIRLLGVAAERETAYVSYCFAAEVNKKATDVITAWRKAVDYSENKALLAVEMTRLDQWLAGEEITPDVWHRDLLAGNISHDATLKFHPTSPWRINLVKEYLAK